MVAFSDASAPPAIVLKAYACLRTRKTRTEPMELLAQKRLFEIIA